MWLVLAVLALLAAPQGAQRGRPAPAATPAPFKTPLTAAQMTNKQAVVETTAGTFIIDLPPVLPPNHAGYFMKQAGEGAYGGTSFQRILPDGLIQGGVPLPKGPTKAAPGGRRAPGPV